MELYVDANGAYERKQALAMAAKFSEHDVRWFEEPVASDDLEGLRTMREVLVSGGRAIVLVPEGKNIYGRLDEVLGHHRRYSKEELTSKMRQAGFEIERILSFNRISRPGWFVFGRLLRKNTVNPTHIKIFDSLVWLWRRIDDLLPWRPVSLIAIGKKP